MGDPWALPVVRYQPGGPILTPRQHAPLGRLLGYRRAAGQPPPPTTNPIDTTGGWVADLGGPNRGLGDVLLALALAQALLDATGHAELLYRGPRATLIGRSNLPITTAKTAAGRHLIHAPGPRPYWVAAIPEQPPAWLDLLREDLVEVHAALPMRYYLAIEQTIGRRLPASLAPTPTFPTTVRQPTPFHVVLVTATSLPDRKDYGIDGFAAVASALAARRQAAWTFTLLTPPHQGPPPGKDELGGFGDLEVRVAAGLDAPDCLDVFATAELVIGNDTGLSHLAALVTRPDGSGPQVVGIYNRHAHTKWTTGRRCHHAAATRFSQMLSAADACPVRDHLDDRLWQQAAALDRITPAALADFAGHQVGWW